MITIVLPVFNEELILKQNTLKVLDFCQQNLDNDWQIIISDNASTDTTGEIGKALADKFANLKYFRTANQGKGYGTIAAWQNFKSDIYIFMDIDLSTDLTSLPALIKAIQAGYDIALGSRFTKGSQVKRTWNRKLFSNFLHLLLKIIFNLKITDTPCGFKAVNQKVVDNIIPQIKNTTWFFDTEMIILAEKQGLSLKETPVNWQENITLNRKSKVKIITTIKDYLKNIFSLKRRLNL